MPENKDAVAQYAHEILEALLTGHAKEHGYRPQLERLLSGFDDVLGINDPKRSAFGNPDFVMVKRSNNDIILGYAEAKDVDIDLDKTIDTEQLRRYSGYDKLLLTNYHDFRFFRNGEEYTSVSIGRFTGGQLQFDPNSYIHLYDELKAFLELPPESVKSGKRLAIIMGGKARRIRDNVQAYLQNEDNEKNQELENIYKMMKELLVHDLSKDKFADMYAQTLVYGLFVARYNDDTPETFSRTEARDLVPASNPFLREFFDHIVGPHFDKRLSHIIDELCEVFSVSNVQNIVHKHLRLFETGNERDPIIHFYEDFLKEYDPEVRKKMGAYYTPVPVVNFIIKSVDTILKENFELSKGLTDTTRRSVTIERQGIKSKIDVHRVQILDPAVGTATFLNEIIKYIYLGFGGQEGRWPSYVELDLLPRIYGFELMMAPYTIAHLKLGMTLQESGVKEFKQRLGVFLTNTLEEGIKTQQDLFTIGLAEVVSHEAAEAEKIKSEKPIMVIMGNPPYSGESSNKTPYAASLVNKYKVEPGGRQKLQERNPKWLNDDYVKFIAFAEDMITKNGYGIMAMITNHSYLDNPTFRGMRWHLTKSFDDIRILDLHGSVKKREIAVDGSKDENVFDIQQGVAIILAVKTGAKQSGEPAVVSYAEDFGTRTHKFTNLNKGEYNWKSITLDSKMLYFIDKNTEGKTTYDMGMPINELFNVGSVGMVTARDQMSIQNSQADIEKVIDDFTTLEPELLREKYKLGKDVRDWSVNGAIQDVKNHQGEFTKISYRPFDTRYTYYTGNSRGFHCYPRQSVMQNFLNHQNVGLMVCRQQKTSGFGHALVHKFIAESSYVSNKTSEIGYTFPLYNYHDDDTRSPNFKQDKLKAFTKNVQAPVDPEDVLDYIYAVLYSPSYRSTYKELLKTGFPRIPHPKNDDHFFEMVGFGMRLRELHLMNTSSGEVEISYPEPGGNYVENVKYEANKVWVNSSQYFGNVPAVAWEFYIGSYQPAQKWLKDRKGGTLTSQEIEHYQKIINVLVETDKIMREIDTVEALET